MDHARPQDAQQIKGSTLRHRECSDESVDKRSTSDGSTAPTDGHQDEKRPIRRVRSPSRPRAWLSSSYKPKFGGRFYKPGFSRDDHPVYKPGYSKQRYHHFHPRPHLQRREYFHPKLHHVALKEREREKEKEKERYERGEWREGAEGSSPPKQNDATRPFLPRSSSSSRDKDIQYTICQSDRNQSRERDHRGTKSKEKEPSRDRELPLTASQTAARDRAIKQKRREIDEVYYQECEMFGLVTKMLIEKDPSLEHPIQTSLQENLRDIGKRCVDAMQKFIDDYDSREPLHYSDTH